MRARADRLKYFRRHTRCCEHRSKGQSYATCDCPIWTYGYIDGRRYRKSLGTTDLNVARQQIDHILGTETLDGQGLTALPLIKHMRDKAINLDRFKEARRLLDENANATGYVYFISCKEVPVIKIGFASKDWRHRFTAIQTGSPVDLKVEAVAPGTQEMEQELHRIFDATRHRNEWFKRTNDLWALIEYAATAQAMLDPCKPYNGKISGDLLKCS